MKKTTKTFTALMCALAIVGAPTTINNVAYHNGTETTSFVNSIDASAASLEPHWWGYNVYLSHNEVTAFTGMQTAAIRKIPMPSLVKGVIAGEKWLIKRADKGRGVRIRMTGYGTTAVITGVFSR